MNRSLIVLLFLCLIPCYSFSQIAYQAFTMENTVWFDVKGRSQGGNGYTWYWQYYVAGDTLLNNQTYTEVYLNKLCTKQVETNPYTGETNYYYSNNYTVNDIAIGGIREEDKRVYFYKYDYDTLVHGGISLPYDSRISELEPQREYLLYDFNFVEGDTVWMDNKQFAVFIQEESPIDSHRVYEVRRFQEHPFYITNDYWVEGLGSLSGLFGSFKIDCFSQPTETDSHFCLEKEGTLALGEGNCYDCGDLVHTADLEAQSSILLAPNPSFGIIYLSEMVDAWQLINLSGEIISQNEQRTDQLNLSNFSTGIYFLNLRQNDSWSHHRLVLVE